MKFTPIKIIVTLFILLFLISLTVFFTRFNIAITAKTVKPVTEKTVKLSKPALTVSVIQPEYQTLVEHFFANGTVGSWQEASVSAEVSGLKLIDINASVGDSVQKGQILARFDNSTLNAEITAIKAQVTEAQANSDEARNNANRARELAKQGFYSNQAVSQTLAQEKSALARLESAKANLAIQQLRLNRTVLRAPDSGIITARTAAIGSVVAAGMELFRMNRLGRLEWKAEVTSAELPSIKRDDTVTIEDNNMPPAVIATGTIRKIAPNLDPQTRNAIVYVDILPGSTLKVGQFVRGYFSGNSKKSLTIPSSSIVLRDGFNSVFILKKNTPHSTSNNNNNNTNDTTNNNTDTNNTLNNTTIHNQENINKVSQVKIVTGQREKNSIEVISGLSPTDQIVATGAAFLSDGDTVKVITP